MTSFIGCVLVCLLVFFQGVDFSDGCLSKLSHDVSRMFHTLSRRMSYVDNSIEELPASNSVISSESYASSGANFSPVQSKLQPSRLIRINAPGQRFTATHGISLRKGHDREFVFVIDRPDVTYMAISSNIALEGTNGGPEKYELYMKYGKPATAQNYDQKSTLTASESYIGNVLYSRDITLPKPKMGMYYVLLEAKQSFHELLITSIMDTPPAPDNPSFKIQRIGKYQT